MAQGFWIGGAVSLPPTVFLNPCRASASGLPSHMLQLKNSLPCHIDAQFGFQYCKWNKVHREGHSHSPVHVRTCWKFQYTPVEVQVH
jgi:hypothetical protein